MKSFATTVATVALIAVVLQSDAASGLAVPDQYDHQAFTTAYTTPPRQHACCAPDQWRADVNFILTGDPHLSGGYGQTARDYTNRILALNQTILGLNGTKVAQHRVLLIGQSRVMYLLDLVTGQCVISNLTTEMQRQCVPSHYNYDSSISFGDNANQMRGLVFHGNSDDGHSMTMIVSEKQCAPVFDMSRQLGTDHMVIATTYNFTAGIIWDRSVFNVPPGCQAAEEILHMSHSPVLARILDHFW